MNPTTTTNLLLKEVKPHDPSQDDERPDRL